MRSISHDKELLAGHHDIPITFIGADGRVQTHMKLSIEAFLEFVKQSLAGVI